MQYYSANMLANMNIQCYNNKNNYYNGAGNNEHLHSNILRSQTPIQPV